MKNFLGTKEFKGLAEDFQSARHEDVSALAVVLEPKVGGHSRGGSKIALLGPAPSKLCSPRENISRRFLKFDQIRQSRAARLMMAHLPGRG